MLNTIYSEFLKLKKTYIIPVVFICGILMTIFMFLARFITEHDMPFEKYAYNIEQVNFLMLYTVLFSITAAYIFSREATDMTANILYTYPISRLKIFISKLITLYIVIFFTYAIETLSIPLSYYFLNGIFPEGSLIIKDIRANGYSLFFQFLLTPIPILVANISKNLIIPSSYGILAFILSSLLVNNDLGNLKYIPLTSPYLSSAYFYNLKDINLNYVLTSSILYFILFLFIGMYHFTQQDIN
ncbi:ABC transporter permease [Clostridium kluyveri]|uniref:Transporter n=1 Tax=Clostridium kluyveri TaxID=1534 RepID=A0A1L5F5R5_CLOKL|nr:ABC transporter permease [Clostridium kluyveri]APM38348.1 transporter [Clostridium kluyveri]UZQ50631.1 ABC transporter permease [Clostridium kluyveri]